MAATKVNEIKGAESRPEEAKRALRRRQEGVVVSTKMDKTVVVKVTRQVKHPQYGKFVRVSTKYHAHDEENLCSDGDIVRIVETRPLSKTKRWRVANIVAKAQD